MLYRGVVVHGKVRHIADFQNHKDSVRFRLPISLEGSLKLIGSDRQPDAIIIESKTSQLVTIIMSSRHEN